MLLRLEILVPFAEAKNCKTSFKKWIPLCNLVKPFCSSKPKKIDLTCLFWTSFLTTTFHLKVVLLRTSTTKYPVCRTFSWGLLILVVRFLYLYVLVLVVSAKILKVSTPLLLRMLLVLKGTYMYILYWGGGWRLYNDIHGINLDRLARVINWFSWSVICWIVWYSVDNTIQLSNNWVLIVNFLAAFLPLKGPIAPKRNCCCSRFLKFAISGFNSRIILKKQN